MAEDRFSRARFIRLGAALGVGAAGASVIAACGGGEQGGGGGAPAEEPASGGAATQAGGETAAETSAASGGAAIAQESEVPPGSAVKFEEGGQPAVLVHLENGDFAAYSAICTHQGCVVEYQDGQLVCPCHGSIFDPSEGGEVVSPPADRPLPEIPVEVQDGAVVRA